MKQKSLTLNAFLNALKTITTLFFPLITFPYSSRILGPDCLGKVHFAQSVVSYFAIIASLGISTYATREAAKVRDNKEALSVLVKEIFRINMVATIVAYILLGLSLLCINKLDDYKDIIIICSSLLLFTTIGINWLYQAVEDYLYITVRSLIFQVISVILLFTLVKSKDDYLMYAAINVISNVGANICNFIHSRKYVHFRTSSKLLYRKHIKPIFILFASAITLSIFSSIDTTMLGFMSNNSEVGIYSAGTKVIHMINGLFTAVIIVFFPRMSHYFAKNEESKLQELTAKTTNTIICLALPVITGLYILAAPLIYLLCGKDFASAIWVLRIMCPYIFFSALTAIFNGGILIAMGKEKIQLYSVLVAVISDIVLNSIFIYHYGANGAAFATALSQMILMIFTMIYLKDLVKKTFCWKNLFQVVLATCCMGIAVLFTRNRFENVLLQLFVPFVIGVLVYALMLFVLRNVFFMEAIRKLEKR